MIREGNKYYSECFGKGYFLKFTKIHNRTNITICNENNGAVEFLGCYDKARVLLEYYKRDLKKKGSLFNVESGKVILYKNWNKVVSIIPETAVLEDFFREKIFELGKRQN